MKYLSFTFLFAATVAAMPAHAETTRDKLLEIVETMPNTLASKQALRPIIEKASDAQISAFNRGLYFEEIGDGKAARRYYERSVAALNPDTPGKDAWCVAYKLLRIPDDKADQTHPAVKEMLDLRKALNIPVTAGDLENTATTARIRNLWNALPEAAQAETGPLPKKLSLIERAVALAGRGYAQTENITQPSQASARCWLRGPNLKPFYVEAAKLGLVDFQYDVANDLASAKFPGFWLEAVKWYRQVAANAAPPLSVIAATGAARVSERLDSLVDAPQKSPMTWPEILASYRAGMEAGHEASLVLYADALQRGLVTGQKADEVEAVRLYKSLLDRKGNTYGSVPNALLYWVYAQEKLTALWRAEKLELTEEEQRRYLTLGTQPRPSKQP